MAYYLQPDVHACRSGDLIVFLDLRQDRYFAAPGDALALDASERSLRARDAEGEHWAAKCLAEGLVSQTAFVETAQRAPALYFSALPAAPAFVAALLWAGAAVDQPFGLRRALAALAARRARNLVDAPRARSEAARFASWRPLWPRAFVCLHDTLALAWFMTARQTRCEIVFGVQARPFAAHCWAEVGGEVLNDEREYCASFDVIARA